jgi:DNA-binding transcriptional ArsR family regulator
MKDFLAAAKAAADENRARILLFLRGGELCVCQIIEMLRLAPSTVSKHLDVLDRAGLVESRKQGRWVYYRLAGSAAPPVARATLRWALRCLAEDPGGSSDAARLKTVRRMDARKLCCHYHAR